MNSLKSVSDVLAISYVLILLVNPSQGITVSCGANGVSSSANYNLDTSTSLVEAIAFGDGIIFRDSLVSGSGDNELSYQTSANKASANGEIKSSGSVAAATSIIASSEGAILGQDVTGSGDITAAVSGFIDDTAAIQQANAIDGTISTKQRVISGEIAYAYQDTTINSNECGIRGIALGKENFMDVSGDGFTEDTVNIELQSAAADKALIKGSVSGKGWNYLNRDDLNQVASEENINMGISYLLDEVKGGPAEFVVSATNIDRNLFTANLLSISATQAASYEAPYALTGAYWKSNPYISFYVNPSNKPSNIGNSNFLNALTCSYQTWDSASSQGLFGGLGSTARPSLQKDGTNVIGWKNFGSSGMNPNGLAATTWWNRYGVNGGLGLVSEADIAFNSQKSWSTTGENAKYDVRTTSLHEFGHVLGLKDLTSITNSGQVMYGSYTGIKRNLNNGDIAGIKKLYS